MKKAHIYRNDILTGTLEEKNGKYIFQYTSNYLTRSDAKNIAIAFPLQTKPFESDFLFPFFFNMLSEGNIKKTQCLKLKIDENDHFTRLLKTANNDTIGSIRVEEIIEWDAMDV